MPNPMNVNLARLHPTDLAALIRDEAGRKNVQVKGGKNAQPSAYDLACLAIAGKIEERGDMPGILNGVRAALADKNAKQ